MEQSLMSVEPLRRPTAQSVDGRLDTHEEVCTFRYSQIMGELASIRSTLKWAATLTISAVMTTGGWGLVQWFNASRARTDATSTLLDSQRSQISGLQTQVNNLTNGIKAGGVVINQGPAPTADGTPPEHQ